MWCDRYDKNYKKIYVLRFSLLKQEWNSAMICKYSCQRDVPLQNSKLITCSSYHSSLGIKTWVGAFMSTLGACQFGVHRGETCIIWTHHCTSKGILPLHPQFYQWLLTVWFTILLITQSASKARTFDFCFLLFYAVVYCHFCYLRGAVKTACWIFKQSDNNRFELIAVNKKRKKKQLQGKLSDVYMAEHSGAKTETHVSRNQWDQNIEWEHF